MTSAWRSLATVRSLLALAVGLITFAGLSILRIRIQYAWHPVAPIGFSLTVLMYLIPGVTVGLLASQFQLLHGVLLGLLAAAVVWFEVPLQRAAMSGTDAAQFLALIILFGAVVSAAGSVAAHWAVQRVTSNNRWRGP
jgi:uncharacterized membrane protein